MISCGHSVPAIPNNPLIIWKASLILPVFNITLCLAGLAGIGGGSLISRLLGQSREDEARRVGAFSLWLALAVAAGRLVANVGGLLRGKDAPARLVNKIVFGGFGKKFADGEWLSGDAENNARYHADPYCKFVCSNNFFASFFRGLFYTARDLVFTGDGLMGTMDRLIRRRRRPGLDEACEVYQVDEPIPLTDEDEDILNYDDVDDPDAF